MQGWIGITHASYWRNGLRVYEKGSKPRCYLYGISEQVIYYSLRGFCDLSLKAYAALVYLLLETSSGCYVTFTTAKTGCLPSRLRRSQGWNCSRHCFWQGWSPASRALESEVQFSKTLFYWLHGSTFSGPLSGEKLESPLYKTESRKSGSFFHLIIGCIGKDNRADIHSRGLMIQELVASQL